MLHAAPSSPPSLVSFADSTSQIHNVTRALHHRYTLQLNTVQSIDLVVHLFVAVREGGYIIHYAVKRLHRAALCSVSHRTEQNRALHCWQVYAATKPQTEHRCRGGRSEGPTVTERKVGAVSSFDGAVLEPELELKVLVAAAAAATVVVASVASDDDDDDSEVEGVAGVVEDVDVDGAAEAGIYLRLPTTAPTRINEWLLVCREGREGGISGAPSERQHVQYHRRHGGS